MRHLSLLIILVAALTACNNYGTKVTSGPIEVFYKDGITKDEAEKTAALIAYSDKQENNNTTQKRSFQLTQAGDTVLFKMVADKAKTDNMPDEVFLTMANLFADSIFNHRPVNVELTDNLFKTRHVIHYKKLDWETEQKSETQKVTEGNLEVYYTNATDSSSAAKLAVYLNADFNPKSMISFQLLEDNSGYPIVNMASTPEKAATLKDEDYYSLAADISKNVFGNSNLTFQVTDVTFTPIKTYSYKP